MCGKCVYLQLSYFVPQPRMISLVIELYPSVEIYVGGLCGLVFLYVCKCVRMCVCLCEWLIVRGGARNHVTVFCLI